MNVSKTNTLAAPFLLRRQYARRLTNRFGNDNLEIPSTPISSAILRFLGARLLSGSWFTRHIMLDRWFLHINQQALYAAPALPES